MKKSGYKYQIQQALLKNNWEIISIDSNPEWWDAEHWKIKNKYDSHFSFYLCFIVGPLFEGTSKKETEIHEVKASTEFPTNWNDDSNRIASISMTKGNFEVKLKAFIEDLKKYKNGETSTDNS